MKSTITRFAALMFGTGLLVMSVDLAAAAQENPEQTEPLSLMERLPQKIHRIQEELPAWLQRSGNQEAAGLMQKLSEQVAAQQFEEAEKTANALLKLMQLNAPQVGTNEGPREGKKLTGPPSGSPEEITKRLTAKVERVSAGAQKWAASGRDPAEIIKTMQGKFQPLMEAGKIAEAEAVVDQVLKQLGVDAEAAPAAPADDSSAEERVLTKIRIIQKELPAWIKKTGRKSEADPLRQKLKEQLADMNFAEAEKSADKILELLGLEIAPAAQAEQPKTANDPTPTNDPLATFFPHQIVLLAGDRIALTAEQRDALLARVGSTHSRSQEVKLALERESAALSELTSQERLDEAAVLAQLNKVLDVERETKLLQARMGVMIKNLLNSQQQVALRELMRNPDAIAKLEQELQQRIAAKVDRIAVGAQQWAQRGRDPSPISQAMEENVRPLMDSGRIFEAEIEIDRVLEQLSKDAK